jgi:hypothetical protein
MVYPTHNRLVVRGKFSGSPEIWSYGLHFNSVIPAAADVLPGDWNATNVTNALNAFHSTSSFATTTQLWGWRGYQIGPDGRTIGNNLKVVEYASAIAGTGSLKYPPQVALAMTLQASARGPARLGRCFLPGPSLSIQTVDMKVLASDTTTLLNNFKTMIEALKNAMYPVTVVGESLVNVSRSGSGVMQDVTKYRCGRALDTIRTRRNKLVEDYQELSA